MKLFILLVPFLTSALTAEEDKSFFEKKYGVSLEKVKKIEEYDKPEAFYSQVAAELGIGDQARKELLRRERRTFPSLNEESVRAMCRRVKGTWMVMIFAIADPDRKEVIVRYVKINDEKKIVGYGEDRKIVAATSDKTKKTQ